MEPWRAPALYKGVPGCQAASAGSPHRRALPVLPHLLLTFQCWLLIHLLKSKNQQKPQWGGNRTCPWLFSAPRAAIRLLDRDGRPASFPEVLRHSSIIPWRNHIQRYWIVRRTLCVTLTTLNLWRRRHSILASSFPTFMATRISAWEIPFVPLRSTVWNNILEPQPLRRSHSAQAYSTHLFKADISMQWNQPTE